MLTATVWLIFSSMLYTLRLDTGSSFPKPLSAEEERHYLALASEGDLQARNILIERNLRLVAHIMKKYYAQTSDQEDLISIGTIGLIKGISSFDPSKGARLATYAARCVENAILTSTRQLLARRSLADIGAVKTTGIAGGLSRPYKGLMPATPQGVRKIRQSQCFYWLAPLTRGYFYLPLFTGSPVNGSIYSFMLI